MDSSFSSVITDKDSNDLRIIYPVLNCQEENKNEFNQENKSFDTCNNNSDNNTDDNSDNGTIISDNTNDTNNNSTDNVNVDNTGKHSPLTVSTNLINESSPCVCVPVKDEKKKYFENTYWYYELAGLLTLVSFGGFICYKLLKK